MRVITIILLAACLISCSKVDQSLTVEGRCNPNSQPKSHICKYKVILNLSDAALNDSSTKLKMIHDDIAKLIEKYEYEELSKDSNFLKSELLSIFQNKLKGKIGEITKIEFSSYKDEPKEPPR